MPSELFYLDCLESSISNRRGIRSFLLSARFIIIPVFNAKSVDPDQTPRSAASDLGLKCLSVPFYRRQGINGLNQFEPLQTENDRE